MILYNFIKKIKNKIVELYTFNFYNFKKNIKVYYDFYSDEELIDEIITNNKSIARFGDGEFKLIYKKNIGFQNSCDELSNDLKKVLYSKNDNIIVCIPKAINDISKYNEETQKFYRYYYFKFRKKLESLIPNNNKYGDALITRFYIDYEDKSTTDIRIKNLSRIWDGKKILIVEGCNSKLGVGNDLFKSAIGIRRILTPNKNAYYKKQEIYNCIIKNRLNDEIVILAIGPTATVLAYDLCNVGIQSIDLGHIDLEYEWYKRGAKEKTIIEGKNVNELNCNYNDSNEEKDEKYNKSIICKIK